MSSDPRHLLGAQAEDQAARYLSDLGYTILERNVSYRAGELDIVAEHEDCLVFVEVRSRSNPAMVHPAATVNRRKQRQIIRAAMIYCQKHGVVDKMIRFDVVAVLGPQGDIELYPNAFEADR